MRNVILGICNPLTVSPKVNEDRNVLQLGNGASWTVSMFLYS